MNTKLKDCPFCGEPAESDSQRGFIDVHRRLATACAVYCTRCPADVSFCCDDYPDFTTKQLMILTIETWNKRV